MNVLIQPLNVFYVSAMRALMPMRRRGVFGTPDEPIYFEANDNVPWWIECRWPPHAKCWFGVDAESYFQNGVQKVRPLKNLGMGDYLLHIDCRDWCALIVGAPTHCYSKPRPRIPRGLKYPMTNPTLVQGGNVSILGRPLAQ